MRAAQDRVRSTFRSVAAERDITVSGFAIVDLLDEPALTRVRSFYDSVGPAPDDPRNGFFPGIQSSSITWRRSVRDGLRLLVGPRLSELFDDHHVYFASFLTKWPGPDGVCMAHRDPSMVEGEWSQPGMTVWCPLADIDCSEPDRGTLWVVPGSHRVAAGDESGLRICANETNEFLHDLLSTGAAVPIHLAAGQALVMDHRLIHLSTANRSDVPRVVMAAAMRRSDARNIHVEYRDDVIEQYAVDDDFYLSDRSRGVTAARYGRPSVQRRRPLASVASADVALLHGIAPTAGPTRRSSGPGSHNAIVDVAVQRRLLRDGFARVPLLDAGRAQRLRDAYGELHGWGGEGFQVDFWHEDPEYRRTVSEALGSELDDAVVGLFRRYRPFLRNFLVKFPGAADQRDFPQRAHRDWAYTDERAGWPSFTVWVALEDIDGANGQLRVVRGSHRLDSMLRGTNIQPRWLMEDRLWCQRQVSVPVRAGEAVIMDASLVHSSWPNLGQDPRVAAAIAVAPLAAQLVHYRRLDPESAIEYEVDDEFFLRYRVGDPIEAPMRDVVEIGEVELDDAALRRRLDRQPLAVLDRIEQRLRQRRGESSAAESRRWRPGCSAGQARKGAGPAPSLELDAVTPVASVVASRSPEGLVGWRDHKDASWPQEVESAFAVIRSEVDELLRTTTMPLIEDVVGEHQGNVGVWRTFLLFREGVWAEDHAARCPATAAVVARVPGLRSAGFSLLEPGTHIPEHHGPDPGILRYHLGVIVPGPEGACRLRVGDELRAEGEGRSLMFEDGVAHEAWNDSDSDRVVLVVDTSWTPV